VGNPIYEIQIITNIHSYAGGQSEVVMGLAIKKYGWKRNDLVISTKLNWGGANGEVLINNHGLSRKHIVEGLEASLERLQLRYVDIVYAHRPDRLTPMEETVRGFNYVIEKGMAFYWGTSEWSADEISEACGIAKQLGLVAPVVEQPLYNILDRTKVEGEFQRLYQRCGIGLTTFSPIKMGLLSGKYNDATDKPPAGSRFDVSKDKFADFMRGNYGNEEWSSTIAKVAKLRVHSELHTLWTNADDEQPIAEELGVTQSQLAIAWCLKNENVSSVITGASRPEQIVENVKSVTILDKLTPELMKQIDEITANKPAMDPARQD
jgi:voltage-dependent potassium channel beta subunit